MAVRKINNNWYVDIRHQRIRRRLKSPENSKRGAQAYELTLRQQLVDGENIQRLGMKRDDLENSKEETLFKDFAEDWMKTYVKANNKSSEQKKKRQTLNNHLLPHFSNYSLTKITPQVIESYKAKLLKTGLSHKTVNNHLTILRRALHCAKDWGLIDRMPEVKRLKAHKPAIEYLSSIESEKLLAQKEPGVWHLAILVALRTGMRIGEILALHWEDVNLTTGQLVVRKNLVEGKLTTPKNNRIRYIPICPELSSGLSDWQKIQGRKTGYIFLKTPRKPYSSMNANDALKRVCKSAGIKGYSFHKLRHTFATQLVAKGVPLRVVQELLGHSTITMTEKYSHVADAELRSAVNLFGLKIEDFGHYMGTRNLNETNQSGKVSVQARESSIKPTQKPAT